MYLHHTAILEIQEHNHRNIANKYYETLRRVNLSGRRRIYLTNDNHKSSICTEVRSKYIAIQL